MALPTRIGRSHPRAYERARGRSNQREAETHIRPAVRSRLKPGHREAFGPKGRSPRKSREVGYVRCGLRGLSAILHPEHGDAPTLRIVRRFVIPVGMGMRAVRAVPQYIRPRR